jgi:hypothetical protein
MILGNRPRREDESPPPVKRERLGEASRVMNNLSVLPLVLPVMDTTTTPRNSRLPTSNRSGTTPPGPTVERNRRSKRRSLGWNRLFYVAIVVLAGAGLLVIATLIFGEVSGTEFSPESLETRTFTYYEIPGIRRQISPVRRNVTVGEVERQIQRQNLVTLQPSSRWDLATADRWNEQLDPRGASILLHYFRARTDVGHSNREYWGDWTVTHASLAAVLWPEVVQLARRRLYLLIPDVMEVARRAANPLDRRDRALVGTDPAPHPAELLYLRIAQTLERRCHELAEIHQELGDTALSQQLRSWAEQYAERRHPQDVPHTARNPTGTE